MLSTSDKSGCMMVPQMSPLSGGPFLGTFPCPTLVSEHNKLSRVSHLLRRCKFLAHPFPHYQIRSLSIPLCNLVLPAEAILSSSNTGDLLSFQLGISSLFCSFCGSGVPSIFLDLCRRTVLLGIVKDDLSGVAVCLVALGSLGHWWTVL